MIPRLAIILTHNRPELLRQAVCAIEPQVNKIYVIDNASDPPVQKADFGTLKVSVIPVADQPPNLSRLWNVGLDFAYAAALPHAEWDVALLCDDVVAPEGWFEAVSDCMRLYGAAAGSTHQYQIVSAPILKTAPDGDIWSRMCGWAFVVAGEKGLRADESLHWWWCDTDMDFQARGAGGMVICPGPVAHNIHPNDWTNRKPELTAQTVDDGATFARKWGGRPW